MATKRKHVRTASNYIYVGGDFDKTYKFLRKFSKVWYMSILEKCGKQGLEALKQATPRDTGLTAESWSYRIFVHETGCSVIWENSNVVNGWANVALLIQYGHATGAGVWVEGIDYINPALAPVFEKFGVEVQREVTST